MEPARVSWIPWKVGSTMSFKISGILINSTFVLLGFSFSLFTLSHLSSDTGPLLDHQEIWMSYRTVYHQHIDDSQPLSGIICTKCFTLRLNGMEGSTLWKSTGQIPHNWSYSLWWQPFKTNLWFQPIQTTSPKTYFCLQRPQHDGMAHSIRGCREI